MHKIKQERRKRRRVRLRLRITILILTLFLFTLAITTGYIINNIYSELMEHEKLLGITYAEFLANNSEEALVGGDDLSLAKFITQVKDKPGVKYAIIMDTQQRILAHTQYKDYYGKVFTEFSDINEENKNLSIRQIKLGKVEASYSLKQDESGEDVLDIHRPILIKYSGMDDRTIGAVRVGISLKKIRVKVKNTLFRFLLAGIIGLLLGIMGSVYLATYIVKPIMGLAKGVQAISEGNFDYQIEMVPGDEIGDLTGSFNSMARSLKEKEFIKQTFSTYVTKQVADLIMDDPSRAGIQGERRSISILFVDIRNFTRIAEEFDAQKVVNMLNMYFSTMVRIVANHNGTVDKFLGDAMMALFGAPIYFEDHARMAVKAALEIRKGISGLNDTLVEKGFHPILIGIGINSGDVVVGNIGSEGKKMEYTAIGDNVNIASRLQGLARRNNIIISHNTFLQVKDHFVLNPLKPVMLKGKEKPMTIYEVLGETGAGRTGLDRL